MGSNSSIYADDLRVINETVLCMATLQSVIKCYIYLFIYLIINIYIESIGPNPSHGKTNTLLTTEKIFDRKCYMPTD